MAGLVQNAELKRGLAASADSSNGTTGGSPPARLRPISAIAVAELLLTGADETALFGIGTRRPSAKRAEPHPYAYFPVVVRDWREVLPVIMAQLNDMTVYWNLATFKANSCPIRRARKQISWYGKMVWYTASKAWAKEILAINIDLDFWKFTSMDADTAQQRVLALCDDGVLPPPTFIARSGHGLYLTYLLTDSSKPRRPPPYTQDTAQLRGVVIDLLFAALAEFSPDNASKNLVQFFKAPDTKHLDGRVIYRMFDAEHGPYWTLAALANFPGLTRFRPDATRSSPRPRQSRSHSRKVPPGRYAAPSWKKINELWTICKRRGITEGMRKKALLYFVTALRFAYLKNPSRVEVERRIRQEAFTFNSYFNPPLPQTEVEDALRARAPKPHRNATVATNLRITRAEAEELQLTSIIPVDLARERERLKADKREAKIRRQQQCDELLREGVPATVIAAELGMSASTVRSRAAMLRKRGGRLHSPQTR